MADEKQEHVLKFESDDYYGPCLKLVFDCHNPGAVCFTIEGDSSGMTASVDYSLFTPDDVDKVIAELTAWRERYRERVGR